MKKKILKKVSTRKSGGATGNRSRHFRPDVDGRVLKSYNIDQNNLFALCQDTEPKKSRLTESPAVASVCDENCLNCFMLPFCEGV